MPMNSATAAMTTRTPRIVGYQRSRSLMPLGGQDEKVHARSPIRGSARSRMIALIWSLVRMLPKCAMRPVEMPRTP